MNKRLTYKQAFDKLTEAYIKDEIQPYNGNFCFCGTLSDNNPYWRNWDLFGGNVHSSFELTASGVHIIKREDYYPYTGNEYTEMETIFLTTIKDLTIKNLCSNMFASEAVFVERKGKKVLTDPRTLIENHPDYEDAIFTAFEKTLEYLKQIHIKRGEVIDEAPVFVKRAAPVCV